MNDVVGTGFPPPSKDKAELEFGTEFTPKFNSDGLITAVVTDHISGDVLMLAHMNAEALAKTFQTQQGWFWSRSRQQLWLKGETSGNVLDVQEIRVDCDQDAVWLKVSIRGNGAACHTGAKSCFYRGLTVSQGTIKLSSD